MSICCEHQNKSEWSQHPHITLPGCSTPSLRLNEATYSLCSLQPPHRSSNSISHWETVEWCRPRRLTGYVYIYLLFLSFPMAEGGLWLCFSCTLLSWEVGTGPKENYSEKSATTLKFCIKITGKPKGPGSSEQPGSGLNYGTNSHFRNSCSYI